LGTIVVVEAWDAGRVAGCLQDAEQGCLVGDGHLCQAVVGYQEGFCFFLRPMRHVHCLQLSVASSSGGIAEAVSCQQVAPPDDDVLDLPEAVQAALQLLDLVIRVQIGILGIRLIVSQPDRLEFHPSPILPAI